MDNISAEIEMKPTDADPQTEPISPHEDDDVVVEVAVHEDDSDEDQPEIVAENKALLLEWVTKADFSKEISLMSLAQHRFRLDQDEMNELTSFEHVSKVIKVLMYKIGLTYKRQDLYRQELLDKIEESSKD